MIKERVIQILDYKKLVKENFFEKIGMTSANFRGSAKKTPLNSTAIENILSELPDVNLEWLITGKGSMLINATEKNKGYFVNEDASQYGNRNNIMMIDVKAAAGLPGNLQNPVFFKDFPTFTLPGNRYKMGKFMCLQVGGDSMYPTVKNGEWVIGQELEDLHFKGGYVHLIVTDDSVLCKRLYKKKHSDYIEVISDNDQVYPSDQLHSSQIQRIYEATDKITDDFRKLDEDDIRREIFSLRNDMQQLRTQVYNIASKK